MKEIKNFQFTVTFIRQTTCFDEIHSSLSSLSFNRTRADLNKTKQPKWNYINKFHNINISQSCATPKLDFFPVAVGSPTIFYVYP